MSKKPSKLDKIYMEFEATYKNSSDEELKKAEIELQEAESEMMKDIMDLEKEIEEKGNILSSKGEQEPEGLKKYIEDKKQELEDKKKGLKENKNRQENLKGYSKNKVQIEKIRSYKQSLSKKLNKENANKNSSKQIIDRLRKEQASLAKKMKDEKYTMSLDNMQYNKHQQLLEEYKQKIAEQTEIYNNACKRITELRAKIGKCDLAWKTLFVNKDWDEIQRRAMSDQERYTRKTDEKHPPLKETATEQEQKVQEEIGEQVKNMLKQKEEEKAENKTGEKQEDNKPDLPAPVSRWDKFKNFFRNLIKGKSARKQQEESKKIETVGADKKEEVKVEEPVVEQVKNSNIKRDEFLEGLRQHVDIEYRNQVRSEKEQQYVDPEYRKEMAEKIAREHYGVINENNQNVKPEVQDR